MNEDAVTLDNLARFGVSRFFFTKSLLLFVSSISALGRAQDLAPRAYIIIPVDLGFFRRQHSLCRWAFSHVPASLPYSVGNFRGTVVGAETNAYHSGWLDSSFRFSINLKRGGCDGPGRASQMAEKRLIGSVSSW
jgi:hypothetical protein